MLQMDWIPTKNFLRRRLVKKETQHCRYPWCGTGVEDSNRLLVRCKFELTVNTGSRLDVSLWLTRNEKTFNNKTKSLKDLIFFSKLRAMAWIMASKIGSAETVWSPPSRGFVKFNVDGAAKSDVAGCLGVMRTKSGVVTLMFAGPLLSFGSDYAEVMAINIALEIFINANWIGKAGLIVESGSKSGAKLDSETF
ncbi:hypothetical protein GQ457_02G031920 [Hibiscus cannabinus]